MKSKNISVPMSDRALADWLGELDATITIAVFDGEFTIQIEANPPEEHISDDKKGLFIVRSATASAKGRSESFAAALAAAMTSVTTCLGSGVGARAKGVRRVKKPEPDE